jgi:hypothetical protein
MVLATSFRDPSAMPPPLTEDMEGEAGDNSEDEEEIAAVRRRAEAVTSAAGGGGISGVRGPVGMAGPGIMSATASTTASRLAPQANEDDDDDDDDGGAGGRKGQRIGHAADAHDEGVFESDF